MDQGTKTIGQFLRDLAASLKRRPLDWKLIDAFARLQEREEEANDDSPKRASGSGQGQD
jgi:hypothetical protein